MNCIPQNIHLALSGSPSEMVVSYLTIGMPEHSKVKYGLVSNQYTYKATGESVTYLKSDRGDMVLYHSHVKMTQLKPSTTYYYVCGDEVAGWSDEYSFTSAPAAPTSPKTTLNTTVVVYGDMGIVNSQHTIPRATGRILNKEADFVWHIGDISYADDYPGGLYEEVWDQWFKQMEPAMRVAPYMVLPGNHEEDCKHEGCKFSRNFTAYNHRFKMPGAESGSNTNMFYSYNYANIHFVSISTETDFPGAPEPSTFGDQLAWLENDLKVANSMRSIYPWILVAGHRPVYSSVHGESEDGKPIKEALKIQAAMEHLFHKYKVDLFICGHVHSYERTYPTYKSEVKSQSYHNAEDTAYVVIGTGGNTEGFSKDWTKTPKWSAAKFDKDYGYALMSIYQEHSKNVLEWHFYSATDNVVQDNFRMVKDI
jgi:hypothetical protein